MSFAHTGPDQHDALDGVPEPFEHTLMVGHGAQAAMLADAFRAGRLHHAQLLAGPAGIGKATFAFRMAAHLLANPRAAQAPAVPAAPVADSAMVRAIARGAHPSVLHLTRPYDDKTKKFKTVISVEEVRRLWHFLSLRAHDGGWRLVIVDPADDLNTSSANALLKSLEEPPPQTVFFVIAHQPGRLLATIRSRCQRIDFAPLQDGEVAQVLGGLGLSLPADAAQRDDLLRRAAGSARAAIMLTEYGGLEIAQAVDRILDGKRFDLGAAGKVADAVAGRDSQHQFAMFGGHLEQTLAAAASSLGAAGAVADAERLASAWAAFGRAAAETDTYNLDKRQFVTSSLMHAHRALHP
jgi:DNA polymerase-3 subunit delta'